MVTPAPCPAVDGSGAADRPSLPGDVGHDGNAEELRDRLAGIDGQGYGAYKRLRDTVWDLGVCTVTVEKVQGDPYAPPSRLRLELPADTTGLPAPLHDTPDRRRALEDHLIRLMADRLDGRRRGSDFSVDAGRQEVLDRTACHVGADRLVFRLGIDLPAGGRRVHGHRAGDLLCDDLPEAVRSCLRWDAVDREAASRFVDTVEDTVALRGQLEDAGLVGFVADGAHLPRRTGIDDRPLEGGRVVPFRSPEALRRSFELPNRGTVTGMAVPEGVTLIVGGGFHGKSTLLRALERGVYDHVPGDGRQLVATRADAVKIRAEDGRRVERVDISAFVGDLPTGQDTHDFSTDNASGSTSQAANIIEALEVGARVLLIDEDTSATNLMIRDERMQELVSRDREPLTPFVDLVRPLHRAHGVSTVLVVGGSGDYFDVADTVIMMDAFVPREVTDEAAGIAARRPGRDRTGDTFPAVRHRVPDPGSVDPRRRGRIRTRARGTDALQLGSDDIDLDAVEQLVEPSQTTGVAQALVRLVEDGVLDGERTVAVALDVLWQQLAERGVDHLRGGYPGDLAMPRPFEVAAALNRLRTLRVAALR